MKMPDLTTVAEAGVRDWSGTSDVVKDAATAAKLAYYSVDLHGIASKADLLHALARVAFACQRISATTGTR